MARGKLPSLPPGLDPIVTAALQDLYLYISQLERSFDTSLQVRGDYTILNSAKGLVLKDTQATPHYWRVTVNNTGTLVTTDLGTAAP